jgi:HAD superfamily hydrolase (TIGR01509 family)
MPTAATNTGGHRAILWDNDGVLVDTEKVFFEANRRELAALGIEASWADFEEINLRGGESLLSLSGLGGDDLRALYARRDALYTQLLGTEAFAIAGMGELLVRLAPRFRMGIVTSSHRQHFEIIHARSGFLPHFAFHVVREDYPLSKPHPDGYLLGIERTGLPPDRCLAVEDSPRGVAAARAAGLQVVFFGPGGVGLEREVGAVFARVANAGELEDALDAWAGR